MECGKWYIQEQCEKIYRQSEIIEKSYRCSEEVRIAVQDIIVAAYKIEADALELDLCDLMSKKKLENVGNNDR